MASVESPRRRPPLQRPPNLSAVFLAATALAGPLSGHAADVTGSVSDGPTFQVGQVPRWVLRGIEAGTNLASDEATRLKAPLSGMQWSALSGEGAQLVVVKPGNSGSLQTAAVPEVCAAYRAPLRLCTGKGQCTAIEKGGFILCSQRFVTEMDVVLRLLQHNDALQQALSSDTAFMRLLRAIRANPDDASSRYGLTSFDETAAAGQWVLVSTFLMSHELYHLSDRGTVAGGRHAFFEQSTDHRPNLRAEQLCRHRNEFIRSGWGNVLAGPLQSDYQGLPEPQRSVMAATTRIWQEENDADEFSAQVLAKVLTRGAQQYGGSGARMMQHDLIQSLALLGLRSWYLQLDAFVAQNCRPFEGQSFVLTRCLFGQLTRDGDAEPYEAASRLFSETHANIMLRAFRASMAATDATLDEHGSGPLNLPDNAKLWLFLIRMTAETAGDVALAGCGALKDLRPLTRSIGEQPVTAFASYSALEGLHGESHFAAGPHGLGKPTPAEIAEIFSQHESLAKRPK